MTFYFKWFCVTLHLNSCWLSNVKLCELNFIKRNREQKNIDGDVVAIENCVFGTNFPNEIIFIALHKITSAHYKTSSRGHKLKFINT